MEIKKTRYQTKEILHDPQNVLQKSMHPENVPSEERRWSWPNGTQSSAQSDDCRISRGREKVTDYRMQFVYKYNHNKPEKVSLSPCKKLPKTGVNRRCHTPN